MDRGFGALQSLTCECPENREQLAAVGGIALMTQLMQRHPALDNVQSAGSIVLARLADDGGGNCGQSVDGVLRALSALPHDAAAQEAGCLTLSRIGRMDA